MNNGQYSVENFLLNEIKISTRYVKILIFEPKM